jgi:hypothetical protein
LKQWTDVSYWSENWREMERLDDAIGYEAYLGDRYRYAWERDRGGIGPKTPYYARHDDTGSLVRLVRCYGAEGDCEHYALAGDYALYYRTTKAELPQWPEIDSRLARLIDGWRF